MKDINGREIHGGDRVRATRLIEGHVVGISMNGEHLTVRLSPTRTVHVSGEPDDGWTITVIPPPRIPEPKNLGDVVEAHTANIPRRREYILADHREGEAFRWLRAGDGWYRWDMLLDPVLVERKAQ